MFALDTETSGRPGIPLWHSQNRLLQVCIFHIESGDVFKHYVKYKDAFIIPPESTKIHGISNLTIESHGLDPERVLNDMLEWVKQRTKVGERPFIFAHNAEFDRNVLRVAILKYLGKEFGKGDREWNWDWFCTCLAARELLPEIDMEYEPKQKPFSLPNLCEHFFKERPSDLHNAVRDVQILTRLFKEVLLPRLPEDKSRFMIHDIKRPRTTLLMNLPGIGIKRAKILADVLASEFLHEGDVSGLIDFSKFIHPPNLLMVGHLMMYGQMRYLQKIRQKEAIKEPLTMDDECTWFEIARHIEILLRTTLWGISDRYVCEILAWVCNRDVVDLVFHTAKEDGTLSFFPTMPGRPVSFLPLEISEREAAKLYEDNRWATLGDILAEFQTVTQSQKNKFFLKFNMCLNKPIDGLEERLKKALEFS